METTLRAGDAVFEQGVTHVSRNDGSSPVVLWIAALSESDQPLTVFEQATPSTWRDRSVNHSRKGETVMRRIEIIASLCTLLLIGTVTMSWHERSAIAQDATPAVPAASFDGLAFAPVDELPSSPAIVGLARLTFPVGAVLPLEAGDPSLALVYVESGTLTVRIEAPVTVSRAPSGEASESTQEEIAAGSEFTARPGDSFVSPAVIAGEARNAGSEPVIVLAAIVEPEPAAETATPAS
jgi:quercetin dioxygenase-like cupin family protein